MVDESDQPWSDELVNEPKSDKIGKRFDLYWFNEGRGWKNQEKNRRAMDCLNNAALLDTRLSRAYALRANTKISVGNSISNCETADSLTEDEDLPELWSIFQMLMVEQTE